MHRLNSDLRVLQITPKPLTTQWTEDVSEDNKQNVGHKYLIFLIPNTSNGKKDRTSQSEYELGTNSPGGLNYKPLNYESLKIVVRRKSLIIS